MLEQIKSKQEFESTQLPNFFKSTGEILASLVKASQETKDKAPKKENESNS